MCIASWSVYTGTPWAEDALPVSVRGIYQLFVVASPLKLGGNCLCRLLTGLGTQGPPSTRSRRTLQYAANEIGSIEQSVEIHPCLDAQAIHHINDIFGGDVARCTRRERTAAETGD